MTWALHLTGEAGGDGYHAAAAPRAATAAARAPAMSRFLPAVLLRAAGIGAALAACGGEPPAGGVSGLPSLANVEARRNPPPLEVTPPRLELPTIPFGGSAQGEFRLRNAGGAPLVITQIGPTGCDCALVDLLLPGREGAAGRISSTGLGAVEVSLAPGEEALLRLEFRSARYREPVTFKTGSIPLLVRDYDYLVLEYSVDLWVPFWAEPWQIELGTIGARQRAGGHLLVRANEEKRFRLIVPEEVDGWTLRASHGEQEGNDFYRIDVTAPPELPLGPFQKEFVLYSDLSGAAPLRFYVAGLVQTDVVHSPTRLLFNPARGQSSAAVTVRVLPEDLHLPLPRASVEGAAPAAFAVTVEELVPGRTFRVTVALSGEPPPPSLSPVLRIELEHEEIKEIRVPVVVVPAPDDSHP